MNHLKLPYPYGECSFSSIDFVEQCWQNSVLWYNSGHESFEKWSYVWAVLIILSPHTSPPLRRGLRNKMQSLKYFFDLITDSEKVYAKENVVHALAYYSLGQERLGGMNMFVIYPKGWSKRKVKRAILLQIQEALRQTQSESSQDDLTPLVKILEKGLDLKGLFPCHPL